jgi:glycosyltransferase involved in cell wall biosynthesis
MDGAVAVSVLIPVYNRRTLVEHAVASALAQDVAGLEVLALDNCSDDGTWEWLQSVRDPRFRCLRNEANVGMFPNFDRCGAAARGRYALFLCSDDRLAPGFLARAVSLMEAQPRAVLLSSRGLEVDSTGRALGRIADLFPPGRYDGASVAPAWFWTAYHYGANPLNYPSGVLFRTSALRECLPFRAEIGAPADIDLYLRVLRHGELIVSEAIGCSVTKHRAQAGSAARTRVSREQMALVEAFRSELEAAGAYEPVRRQAASLAFAALARVAAGEPSRLAQEFRAFGRGIGEMAAATAKCMGLRALALLGARFSPYLRTSAQG